MTMAMGVNTDPQHGFKAIDMVPFQYVRTPPWFDTGIDYNRWAQELQKSNIEPVYVADKRALGTERGKVSYYNMMRRLKRRCPTVKYWQIGNEEDQPNSDSSWYMPPNRFANLLMDAADVFHDCYRIAGGLVSGNVNGYVEEVSVWPVQAVSYHPYGQRPDNWFETDYGYGDVRDLHNLYASLLPKHDIWVTELGNKDYAYDEHIRAVYHTQMRITLESLGVKTALVFCYSDLMVPGYGIVDSYGIIKETYAAMLP